MAPMNTFRLLTGDAAEVGSVIEPSAGLKLEG